MNRTGGVLRARALRDRPGARFFFTRRQKRHQTQHAISALDQLIDAAALDAERLKIFSSFRRREIDQVGFELRADDHAFSSFARADLAHGLTMFVLSPPPPRPLSPIPHLN